MIEVKEDYIVVQGGDGSLIKAVHQYLHLNLPFYGVAKGTINFLMNQEEEPLRESKTVTLDLIKVEIETNSGWLILHSFNEILIGKLNGWIDFNI